MKYKDISGQTTTYMCTNIAEKKSEVCVVSAEPDGDFVVTCGCAPDYVEITHFEHIKPRLDSLLDFDVLPPGENYTRIGKWLPWQRRKNQIFKDD
ncbi:MAG: hypothetical protein ABJF05_07835 [Paracoccaceae bacterium]